MKILSEMPTGMGGKWVLVKYEENFYAYGTENCLHDFLGFPVNQCGSREELMEHCNSIAELCRQNISNFQKEIAKSDSEGWELMIEDEQRQLEMLTKFASVLSGEGQQAFPSCKKGKIMVR